MRARVGIDKTKSWADWVEEEDEAATQIVTPEDSKADAEPKGEPTLRLRPRTAHHAQVMFARAHGWCSAHTRCCVRSVLCAQHTVGA